MPTLCLTELFQLFINSVLQCFSSFELRSLASRDLHGLASLRISSLSCSSLANFESTEANQLDLVLFLQFLSYYINKSLSLSWTVPLCLRLLQLILFCSWIISSSCFIIESLILILQILQRLQHSCVPPPLVTVIPVFPLFVKEISLFRRISKAFRHFLPFTAWRLSSPGLLSPVCPTFHPRLPGMFP